MHANLPAHSVFDARENQTLSDSSDDKPKVSLDTADLKARLGLKRRVKATTDSGVDASVAEARRKAEAEHSQAGTAEEEFTIMGQDNTPAPQPRCG